MWKRIWNKAEKRAGSGGLAGSMTMMNERFSLLPLEGGGAKRRRLAHALYWQNRINEFLQSVRFLNDHGIGLWGRSPCNHCIYSMGRGRESTCDFPLPDVSCLVPYVDLSPLHITPFFSSLFFWKAPYRCHAGIDMVLFHMLCMKSMSVLHSIFSLKYEALYLSSSFGYKSCN